jgi:hypothetical protein
VKTNPPNPRLQRTPSALPPSPLSRKPLGDRGDVIRAGRDSRGRCTAAAPRSRSRVPRINIIPRPVGAARTGQLRSEGPRRIVTSRPVVRLRREFAPNPPLQRTRGAGFARTSSPLNGKPLDGAKIDMA